MNVNRIVNQTQWCLALVVVEKMVWGSIRFTSHCGGVLEYRVRFRTSQPNITRKRFIYLIVRHCHLRTWFLCIKLEHRLGNP
jgi:hypothetical protein